MVHTQKKRTTTCYLCDQCNFGYATKKLAVACERWCIAHHTCNLLITQKATYKPRTTEVL